MNLSLPVHCLTLNGIPIFSSYFARFKLQVHPMTCTFIQKLIFTHKGPLGPCHIQFLANLIQNI
jgi:hypothetical protein